MIYEESIRRETEDPMKGCKVCLYLLLFMKQCQIAIFNSQVYYINFDMYLQLLVDNYEIPIMDYFFLFSVTASDDADTFGECR
jgi:hypothetical protein